jgi:Ser-tRNA(Ala) deacylase AlaX|tara:strand:- start:3035 stop:3508 length:474 start_codon:yes stop_codon:yes gene_type:complete
MATPTELLYFGDTFRFECESRVLSVELIDSPDTAPPTNTKQYAVVLDKTVAYPVGGGQPSDVGKVVCASSETSFSLQRVVAGKDGVVRHVGVFGIPGEETTAESKKGDLNNQFKPGDTVTVTIDQEKRMLHARIHSAGHLLDVAMGKELSHLPHSAD